MDTKTKVKTQKSANNDSKRSDPSLKAGSSASSLDSTSSKTSKGASSMAELMSKHASSMKFLKKGDYIPGMVKKITSSEIFLDIGAKSDALVIEFDKKNFANLILLLKVGDKVKASIISSESEEGFPVVSLRRMLDEMLYDKLEELYKSKYICRIQVVELTRGGYFVETDTGVKGFLPNSQVVTEGSLYGKTLEAKIIEFDKEKKRLIFSEKAKMYISDPSQIGKFVKRDQVVEATIILIVSYGIYVSFEIENSGSIEGFIHISEVAYERIDDLRLLYKKGDVLKAQVLDIDNENRRVNLSLKRMIKDVFEEIKAKYPPETEIKATVLEVKNRGVSVEISKEVKGLISADKIPTGVTYKQGESLTVQVTGVDSRNRVLLVSPVHKTKFVGYR